MHDRFLLYNVYLNYNLLIYTICLVLISNYNLDVPRLVIAHQVVRKTRSCKNTSRFQSPLTRPRSKSSTLPDILQLPFTSAGIDRMSRDSQIGFASRRLFYILPWDENHHDKPVCYLYLKYPSTMVSVQCPIPSMYGIFTHIWLIFMGNVGKSTIHGCYGCLHNIPSV